MLDFGFPELLVIIALAVVVVGPNEIPKLMVGLGRLVRRLQYVRFAVSQQFEDFMQEHDMADIRSQVNFEEKHFDESAADEEIIEAEEISSEEVRKEEGDDER